MNMRDAISRLLVRSAEGDYPVLIGHGLLTRLGALAREQGLGRRVVVATDSTVELLYGETVIQSLREEGFDASIAVMPAGEAHKNWQSVGLYIDSFLQAGLDRSGWVLLLGGGVVGDTGGFAAAVYMRGVPTVQAPTTLLAMADSSIGGKVGVDHPAGKNLLGAFKQPNMVIADLETLSTLPPEQIACGMAEVVKAAIIGDPGLFSLLEEAPGTENTTKEAIVGAIQVKRDIVERDPHEAGERALLNLGHTFGHAFEQATAYSRPHGYGVAQGMAVAFRLAGTLGMCDTALESRLTDLLVKLALPTRWGNPDLAGAGAVERVCQAMHSDKKRRDGKLRLVLPEAIGRVKIVDGVPADSIKKVLMELQ